MCSIKMRLSIMIVSTYFQYILMIFMLDVARYYIHIRCD